MSVERLAFEELDGFQFPSRARRIADWRQRKDDGEFRNLCRRLAASKNARQYYARIKAEGGDKYAAYLATCLRSYRRRRVALCARRRGQRLDLFVAEARVIRCKGCGSTYCRAPGARKGADPLFCDHKCRRRHHGLKRNKGTHTCRKCGAYGHNRRTCGRAVAAELEHQR